MNDREERIPSSDHLLSGYQISSDGGKRRQGRRRRRRRGRAFASRCAVEGRGGRRRISAAASGTSPMGSASGGRRRDRRPRWWWRWRTGSWFVEDPFARIFIPVACKTIPSNSNKNKKKVLREPVFTIGFGKNLIFNIA